MRICLVRCPSPFLIDERAFPPLGLLAVGTGLKQQGHDVLIHDGELADVPHGYDGYGFGATAPEYPYAKQTMGLLRTENPQARFVIGGTHATLNQQDCLRDGWDCVFVGDGEIEAEKAFYGKEKLVVAQDQHLDTYPIPDRTLVDIRSYRYELEGRPTTTLMTSRGCPFKCSFCCKNHTRVRSRSIELVKSEIDYLHELGYRALAFPEDIFILDKTRTESLARHLHSKEMIWRCLVRADILVRHGQQFTRLMKECGCVGVGIGVESGSNAILRTVNKGETSETIMTAIQMLHAEGMKVKGFFIVGLPGETYETLAETERFLKESKLDDIDVKIYQPYPGSPIYDHRESYDIHWNGTPLEDTFYKGRPGDYRGSIATSALTTAQIVEAWKAMETKHKKWL